MIAGGHDGALWFRPSQQFFPAHPSDAPVFLISLVIAAAALLVHYAGVSIPILSKARAFDVLALAYAVLLIGVLVRRL